MYVLWFLTKNEKKRKFYVFILRFFIFIFIFLYKIFIIFVCVSLFLPLDRKNISFDVLYPFKNNNIRTKFDPFPMILKVRGLLFWSRNNNNFNSVVVYLYFIFILEWFMEQNNLYKCIILCIWKQAQVPLINNLCSTYMHKSTKKIHLWIVLLQKKIKFIWKLWLKFLLLLWNVHIAYTQTHILYRVEKCVLEAMNEFYIGFFLFNTL